MKKIYITPAIKEHQVRISHHFLAGSGQYEDVKGGGTGIPSAKKSFFSLDDDLDTDEE